MSQFHLASKMKYSSNRPPYRAELKIDLWNMKRDSVEIEIMFYSLNDLSRYTGGSNMLFIAFPRIIHLF